MRRPVMVGSAALASLTAAAMVVACSGGGAFSTHGSTPTSKLMLTCSNSTLTKGSMTVSVSCLGTTPSGHALNALLSVTLGGTAHTVTASSTSGAVNVSAMSSTSFSVTPQSAGTATVQLQDDQGDNVNVDETVGEDTESPEPTETPEPAESTEPSETPESPEPNESPEPSETPEPAGSQE